jgi:homoserine O-acetyltransferase/O-succinyltransferase
MSREFLKISVRALLLCALAITPSRGQQSEKHEQTWPTPEEGVYVVKHFHFQSGGTLLEVKLHYCTLGKPVKDANGRTTNAVLILHGTGGQGSGFLRPIFAVLFGPGQLLDVSKYDHLRLILGTSMGCMHSWMWGETYVDFMDALMPLACLPVQIAGRNRVWRKMVIDGIREDPDWKNGEYTTEPRAALQISADFLLIATSAPLLMQEDVPTREATGI